MENFNLTPEDLEYKEALTYYRRYFLDSYFAGEQTDAKAQAVEINLKKLRRKSINRDHVEWIVGH